MSIREKYVKVREAAAILGVAAEHGEGMGCRRKLREFRSPANGYRLYKREDLEKYLRQIELTARTAPRCRK